MFTGSRSSITEQGREVWIWSSEAIDEYLVVVLFATASN